MIKLTGVIQTFEPIFEREEITHSQEAAIYYVLSVSDSSLNFTETLREARKIRRTVSQRALTKGRDYLLRKGFLAKVLLTHNSEEEYEQRGYIPLHPKIVFKENEEYLREIYEPEDFSVRKKHVEDLYGAYEDNYGAYGLKMEKGCMTLHYSDTWLVSYISSIITQAEVKTVSMMLSGLQIFKEPYRQYYVDKIEKGLKIRMVFGGEEELEEIEEVKDIRNKYKENVEIRYSPTISRTCKSFIVDDKLAMDGKKLLAIDGETLSYIGILYIEEKECIKNLRRNFEAVWKMSKNLL
ncbi:MAG: hypothetical protein J7K81_01920 [Methanophagales archaeon]|nr:hypothetical protein [Methanophagales archaeon]